MKSGVVGLGVGQHLPPVDEETCPVELRRDAARLCQVLVPLPGVVLGAGDAGDPEVVLYPDDDGRVMRASASFFMRLGRLLLPVAAFQAAHSTL